MSKRKLCAFLSAGDMVAEKLALFYNKENKTTHKSSAGYRLTGEVMNKNMGNDINMKVIARIRTDFATKFGIPRQSGVVE